MVPNGNENAIVGFMSGISSGLTAGDTVASTAWG
jgi:hypothetical protein